MKAQTLPNGAGMEIINSDFRWLGRIALKTVFKIPPPIREVLFGGSKFCLRLQKLLVAALGGSFLVHTKFTDGPMSGQRFACWTSEKYFMLGSHVEDDLQRLLSEIINRGDTVYDVGGHAGYTSLLLSILVGAEGRVFTFEPSPANYARVCSNIDINRRRNVTVINAAISDREGVAFLQECGSMSTLISDRREGVGALSKIATLRLDDFVWRRGNPPPALIKLDVEGHGGPVLEGMTQLLGSHRPIVICELHHHNEEDHVTRILTATNYRLSPFNAHRRFPRRILAAPQ